MRKKENLLVLGMYFLIIAFVLEMAGNANPVANVVVLLFIGLSIYSNARYVILTSIEKKKS
ncbi:MAG: hypothetical protein ACFFA3_00770 [Promethearchaeota archaeon]